jgi:alpha-tubulin suppressor-like RCC1 family protein
MNVNDLELYLQSRISNASTDYDILLYTKAIQVLNSGGVFTANTVSDLPSASQNEGKLYFILDTEILAWSDGSFWKDVVTKAADNQIWTWGWGNCGQLGDGTSVNRSSPVREVSSSINWSAVSAGSCCFSAALKSDGTIWSWGYAWCGRLGDNTTVDKCSPVRERSSSTTWCRVSASGHTIALKTDGTLWAWGNNDQGQLGDNTIVQKSSPVREISSSTNWRTISAGERHSIAIKTDGTLWAWGCNTCGELGNGSVAKTSSPVREITSSTNWCRVSAGDRESAAIKTDGTLWSWGTNLDGQLGDNTVVNKCSPVREISSSTTWCEVSLGTIRSAAIKTDGTLWSWGWGTCGQLGDGGTTSKCSPVREISSSTNWCSVGVGRYHSAAVKTDGTLWSWGRGTCGQLGHGTVIDRSSPVREISSSTNWCSVSAGRFSSAAIKVTL